MDQVTSITPETEKRFLEFLNKGNSGYKYERILLKEHSNRILNILNGGNPPPYELEIQPTATCNANCSHCWGKKATKLENKLLTKENIDRIIEQILDFKEDEFKIEVVKFCGSTGDPLMNPLTLYAIDRLHEKKYLRLFTNGIKLAENKNDSKYLKSISKIDRLNLSLDAGSTQTLHKIKPGSQHIGLEDILQTIGKLKNLSTNGIEIEAGYVITNQNYQEIPEFTGKAKLAGINRIRFRIDLVDREISKKHGKEIEDLLTKAETYNDGTFVVTPTHTSEEIEQEDQDYFSSEKTGAKCFTSKLWACIGSSAHLYPCGHCVSKDTENYGDLLEKDFHGIWNNGREGVISRLPGKNCTLCSPFSLRANEFMTFLSNLNKNEAETLIKKYVQKEN